MHDRDVLVAAYGRICMHRKRVNISTVLAGQRLGIKEVDDGIWIVSFLHYDLGFIDLEQIGEPSGLLGGAHLPTTAAMPAAPGLPACGCGVRRTARLVSS